MQTAVDTKTESQKSGALGRAFTSVDAAAYVTVTAAPSATAPASHGGMAPQTSATVISSALSGGHAHQKEPERSTAGEAPAGVAFPQRSAKLQHVPSLHEQFIEDVQQGELALPELGTMSHAPAHGLESPAAGGGGGGGAGVDAAAAWAPAGPPPATPQQQSLRVTNQKRLRAMRSEEVNLHGGGGGIIITGIPEVPAVAVGGGTGFAGAADANLLDVPPPTGGWDVAGTLDSGAAGPRVVTTAIESDNSFIAGSVKRARRVCDEDQQQQQQRPHCWGPYGAAPPPAVAPTTSLPPPASMAAAPGDDVQHQELPSLFASNELEELSRLQDLMEKELAQLQVYQGKWVAEEGGELLSPPLPLAAHGSFLMDFETGGTPGGGGADGGAVPLEDLDQLAEDLARDLDLAVPIISRDEPLPVPPPQQPPATLPVPPPPPQQQQPVAAVGGVELPPAEHAGMKSATEEVVDQLVEVSGTFYAIMEKLQGAGVLPPERRLPPPPPRSAPGMLRQLKKAGDMDPKFALEFMAKKAAKYRDLYEQMVNVGVLTPLPSLLPTQQQQPAVQPLPPTQEGFAAADGGHAAAFLPPPPPTAATAAGLPRTSAAAATAAGLPRTSAAAAAAVQIADLPSRDVGEPKPRREQYMASFNLTRSGTTLMVSFNLNATGSRIVARFNSKGPPVTLVVVDAGYAKLEAPIPVVVWVQPAAE
ncbi:hypothetical protein PLESTB_000707000 [Pleodorina starrii]|uniref:Uncharacterized protein n=1 Tax=Pleodorina starrii TaxID=330485 RepID=A0A9W6BJP8_9CHLO|nr:hypothetical protein PLESTB_000051500 [Pleodorina starrii]GLC53093.1 hypothetical protein PLESTB_000707000 [Pleodorina starrii]